MSYSIQGMKMAETDVPGTEVYIAESLAEDARAYRRIRAPAAEFIPPYDPEVLRKYPNGIVR